MYELPILWGTPQSMNPGSALFVAAWAAVTAGACIAFLFAMAAERRNLQPHTAIPGVEDDEDNLHRAA